MKNALATIAVLVALMSTTPRGQTPGGPGGTAGGQTTTEGAEDAAAAGPAPANAAPSVGAGRPVLIIPATTDTTGEIRLQLPLASAAAVGDLEIGPLTSTTDPAVRITPRLELLGPAVLVPGETLVTVSAKVSGLFPFGESSAPIFRNGRLVETLRFHKAGMTLVPPAEGSLVARESDGSILLELANASAFDYGAVGARVRVLNLDACAIVTKPTPTGSLWRKTVQRFGWSDETAPAGRAQQPSPGRQDEADTTCAAEERWPVFAVPKSSRISLHAKTHGAWFRDPETNFYRTATRKGTLTLRYRVAGTDGAPRFSEQVIPFEARFVPSTRSATWSLAKVAGWLVFGAVLSLVLRVSIPNYRRKKTLKSQLDESRRMTAEISDQVDSQLRVLLRVERLLLDQRRRDGYVIFPAFAETASLVEAGLITLRKKIAFVQRLDACACRQEALFTGPVSPTRMNIIDQNITHACEVLKSDQLSDADWIFVLQRLEAADKALNEPTQEEKQAFEALLSRRWKAVRDHFASDDRKTLRVPSSLAGLDMSRCFPDASLIPEMGNGDEDGLKWIDAVGVVQADLQITALELLRDVQYRAAALGSDKWKEARKPLAEWLTNPAIGNLTRARQQLMQVAEGVSEDDVLAALRGGQAEIDLDPQIVSPNQTVRLSVRLRDARLNEAAARSAVQCEWLLFRPVILEPTLAADAPRWKRLLSRIFTPPRPSVECRTSDLNAAIARAKSEAPEQRELGWKVHRYFEPNQEQTVQAVFYYQGQQVMMPPHGADPAAKTVAVECTRLVRALVRRHHLIDRQERYWRFLPQFLQLLAALIVPLAALALSTTAGSASGQWWELVGLGFGSETIRSILTGQPAQPATTANG